MKVCIIFRGENVRMRKETGDKPVHASKCIPNWNHNLFSDLQEKKIEYDTVLITYGTAILEELVTILNPVYVATGPYNSQMTNMRHVADFMTKNKDVYDRFVVLRFDFIYRLRITQWRKWNETGMIIVNRDVTYPHTRYCADIVFVVDRSHVDIFREALYYNNIVPHQIGTYLHREKIPYHLMYSDFYHMSVHPLHVLKNWDKDPTPDENYQAIIWGSGEKLEDDGIIIF